MTDLLGQRRVMLVAALPTLSALTIYGIAHNRWLIAAPLVVLLLAAIAAGKVIERQPWHLIVAIILGTGLGLLTLSKNDLPPSALPAVLLSPMCASLACLAVLVVIAQRYMYSWTYAWLLVAFCLNVPPEGVIWIAFLGMTLSTLACCYVIGGGYRLGTAGGLGFLLFLLVLTTGTLGISRLALRSEDALLAAFMRWARTLEPPTGLSIDSELDLPGRSRIELSMRPVLEFSGTPPAYLRTMVMEKFDGGDAVNAWRSAEGPRRRGEVQKLAHAPTPAAPSLPLDRKLEMLMLEPLGDVLPMPASTYAIDGVPSRVEQGWVWRTPSAVHSALQVHWAAGDPLPNEPSPENITQFLPPKLKTTFEAIARDIVKDAATTREKADRIVRFFHAEFQYSLDTDLTGAPGESPLLVLIRERRPAYCVYFASAMAVLLRSLDIPARIATGFLPDETNPVNGKTVVRVRDAHAWVEVYLSEEGRYVPYDPTPAQGREDALKIKKVGWVSGFVQAVGSALRRAWVDFREDPLGTIVSVMLSRFVVVPISGLTLWLLWRRRHTKLRQRADIALETSDATLRRAYRRYVRLLVRAGVAPARSDSDDELIERLQKLRGAVASRSAEAFMTSYRQARYGTTGASTSLRSDLDELEATLRRTRGEQPS